MTSDNNFDIMMLEAAEKVDRELGPGRIKLLRQSFDYFKEAGHTDEQIKEMMALTAHEMRLIRQSRN